MLPHCHYCERPMIEKKETQEPKKPATEPRQIPGMFWDGMVYRPLHKVEHQEAETIKRGRQ